MNVKNYLTLAGVLGLAYGIFFFFMSTKVHEIYGATEIMNDLSVVLIKFLGASVLASGVMALMARNAHMSIGRKAILIYMAVSFTLFLYLNIMGLTQEGDVATMEYVDVVIGAIMAIGAIYFITKEKTASAD